MKIILPLYFTEAKIIKLKFIKQETKIKTTLPYKIKIKYIYSCCPKYIYRMNSKFCEHECTIMNLWPEN